MEYLDQQLFSEKQKWIVKKKVEGESYKAIKKLYKDELIGNDSLSCEVIQTCLKRSSLSLQWIKGYICGNIPLLSEVDVFALKQYVIDNPIEGCYLNVEDTVEKANFLRAERFKSARKFLTSIDCYGILAEINKEQQIHDAGRSWVFQHIQELEADIMTPRNIELNRLMACTPDKIDHYTATLFPILREVNPALRFCADETMLNPAIHRKLVVPSNSNTPLLPENSPIPHMTAMCCCNVLGDKMPLFIILNSLVKLPTDLKSYDDIGDAIFASSSSGWQTREKYLWFAICFINWLSLFRLKLDKSIRNSRAILIVDGHKSRECPIAIQMLRQNNIDLFVIPVHTSHVTQLFDVGIGSPMKSFFTDVLKKLMDGVDKNGNVKRQLRLFIIQAAIILWDSKCNKNACLKAARQVGINPINDEYLKNNSFVAELTPEVIRFISSKKKVNGNDLININCKLITSDENLNVINEYIKGSKFHKHLTIENYNCNYINTVPNILSRNINDCHFLSRARCYFDANTCKLIDFTY